jgi:hypothetical protein
MLDSEFPQFQIDTTNFQYFSEIDLKLVHSLRFSIQSAEAKTFEKHQINPFNHQREKTTTPLSYFGRRDEESANLCD